MNAVGDYHDPYLKTDVLLLADVFEKFIITCLEYYGLDPCHYFSNLGLSLDAMLKVTGIELELISDIDIRGVATGETKVAMPPPFPFLNQIKSNSFSFRQQRY